MVALEGMGFIKTKDDLFRKEIDCGTAFWDFRKTKRGKFYVSKSDNTFLDDALVKELDEYKIVRHGGFKPASKIKPVGSDSLMVQESLDLIRGGEESIRDVIMKRNLDLISRVASDGVGEGILYHNLGNSIGMEPSAELVDMISSSMGCIRTELVEQGMHRLISPDGEEYQTYFAVVRAVDDKTGASGLGTAEEVIDFKEIVKTGRTFSLTKAIRKAERNAKERLIPVPRKALVELIKEIISNREK